MDFFKKNIHQWYAKNKRPLPWRETDNPYFIWLSEIILQQTRVDQGLAYYLKFTEEYPTINDLANASEDQVLKLWQGLGYYSRARNLLFTAKFLQEHHKGKFPEDYATIRSLKGIGDYSAAAIASISFNLEYPVVDGNVFRVLSRFFGIGEPIDTTSGKKAFFQLAKELISGEDPGMHNQAMMEFGALQCIPQKPDCPQCPLNERCEAYNFNRIGELPNKLGKTQQRNRYFTYLFLEYRNSTWLTKRVEQDIWKGLFEFPLVETEQKTDLEYVLSKTKWLMSTNAGNLTIRKFTDWKVHLLSHQKIHFRVIYLSLSSEIEKPGNWVKVSKQDIFNFAIPRLLEETVAEFSSSGCENS